MTSLGRAIELEPTCHVLAGIVPRAAVDRPHRQHVLGGWPLHGHLVGHRDDLASCGVPAGSRLAILPVMPDVLGLFLADQLRPVSTCTRPCLSISASSPSMVKCLSDTPWLGGSIRTPISNKFGYVSSRRAPASATPPSLEKSEGGCRPRGGIGVDGVARLQPAYCTPPLYRRARPPPPPRCRRVLGQCAPGVSRGGIRGPLPPRVCRWPRARGGSAPGASLAAVSLRAGNHLEGGQTPAAQALSVGQEAGSRVLAGSRELDYV